MKTVILIIVLAAFAALNLLLLYLLYLVGKEDKKVNTLSRTIEQYCQYLSEDQLGDEFGDDMF